MSLVDDLIEAGILQTDVIIDAFRAVPRSAFLPPEVAEAAEENVPLPIGEEQTNTQPQTLALMLELLQPRLGQRVLDVGSGSGWSSALLAKIVGPTGSVTAVEIKPALCALGQKHLAAAGMADLVQCRSGSWETQLADEERFDCILVSAVDAAVPARLKLALADGGVLVMPVEEELTGDHALVKLTREGNDFTKEEVPGFQFVPLL